MEKMDIKSPSRRCVSHEIASKSSNQEILYFARLRNVPAESELSFNDILQAYPIERFLVRLSQSPQVDTTAEDRLVLVHIPHNCRLRVLTAEYFLG